MLKNSRLGRFDIKALKLSANRIIRINPAQYHVRISDRWPRIAEAVGDRPRRGPRAFGADIEQSTLINPSNRTAACADRRNLDHGRAHDHPEINGCLR